METKEWRFVDKSKWPRGEWDNEPDKMQWRDEATGMACLIHRGPSGALCGYVGVPEGHPWYGKDWGDIDAQTHGGLTFSRQCAETTEEGRGICHVPGPGEPKHLWWVGFDCAHWRDYMPAFVGDSCLFEDGEYRSMSYVKHEVGQLASQAKEALPT